MDMQYKELFRGDQRAARVEHHRSRGQDARGGRGEAQTRGRARRNETLTNAEVTELQAQVRGLERDKLLGGAGVGN